MIPTTELEPYLQKQVDAGIPGTDILHGALKNMMLDCENILIPLLQNSNELGSDENYDDTVQRLYNEGYMDALTDVYALTYNLSFAIQERTKSREA